VSFSSSGTGTFSPSSTCTISGTGASAACSFTYTPISAICVHIIVGSYSGDSSHSPSSGSFPLTVSGCSVGGVLGAVDKLDLLAPFIGLGSLIVAATTATAIYVRRVRRGKENE
jgi:hypothetical protein